MRAVPLTPGTRLGPYEILSAIGAGGMGVVPVSPEINDGKQQDVWLYESATDRAWRLAMNAVPHQKPVWTPDGILAVSGDSPAERAPTS